MRKYVKRLTLLLAAALLIGSIAGCGASESASVNATSVTESGEAASETTTSKSAESAEAAASAEPAAAEDSSVEETPVRRRRSNLLGFHQFQPDQLYGVFERKRRY